MDNFTMVNESFAGWIDGEIAKRNWSRADLCRRAHISQSTLSMLIAGERGLGASVAASLAETLRVPIDTVYRAYGMLSTERVYDERIERIIHMMGKLDDSDQELLLTIALSMLEREGHENKGKGVEDTPSV